MLFRLAFFSSLLMYLAQAGSIIVPLYIYPTAGAWKPLLTALKNYPTLDFWIIVNPNSGPTNFDSTYQSAVTNVKTFRNAKLIGYVRTGYGQRSLAAVKADVSTYASWPAAYSMQGIFFDKTKDGIPSYYSALYKFVHQQTWAESTSTSVILNPGTSISASYFGFAEQIVIFEQSFAEFTQQNLNIANTKSSVMIHSFEDAARLSSVVKSLSKASSIFITSLNIATTDVYASFSPIFNAFVADVAGTGSSPGTSSKHSSFSTRLTSSPSNVRSTHSAATKSSSSRLPASSGHRRFRPLIPTYA